MDTRSEFASMKRFSRIAITLIVAVLLLLLADRIFAPVPVPAGAAVLGGLLAMWLRTERRGMWVAAGWIVGGLIGAGIHVFVHMTGGSTPPEEGVPAHVAADVILGLAVAATVLLIAWGAGLLPSKVWKRRAGD